MTTLNLGLFGPLARRVPVHAFDTALVTVNLAGVGVAAYLGARAVDAAPVSIVLFAAWLAYAPLTDALAGSAIGATYVAGAFGLLVPGRSPGRVQRSFGATLLCGSLALAWAPTLGLGARPPIFWSAPHEQNAAAGAFFSRLYAGPGALAADGAPPVAAAEALTAGTLACFGLLTAWFLWMARPLGGSRAVTACCLALVVALALWPITPPSAAALAPLALVPFADSAIWSGVRAHWWPWLAGFVVSGYLLAGTSTPALSKAATELFSLWPALASAPALGLVFLALALALALR
jgi:hypothetical protein